jgi:glycosyltransferase involved in cell wall biosynthesis
MPALRSAAEVVCEAIRERNPDIVHFHLTIGLGSAFYELFPTLGIPYVVSLHDYYLFCPRITMIDFSGSSCGGPETRKCESCIGVFDQVPLAHRAARRLEVKLPRVPSHTVTRRNARVAFFFREAAGLLAVSGRVKELYSRAYPEGRYSVLHIGSSSAYGVRATKPAGGVLRITAMGTLADYKGAGILEQIASLLKRNDVEVSFWGRVDNPKWIERCKRANILLKGPYAPGDLNQIMAETDLGLVVPVWEDNAPQVVMEFLNFGVPVLATQMGGIPDFVTSETGYLFDPSDPRGVARAVAFIEGLDVDEVRKWGASIERLATPEFHERGVREIYLSAAS